LRAARQHWPADAIARQGARSYMAANGLRGELMLLALFGVTELLLRILMYIIILQAILSWLVAFNVINTYNDFVRSFLNALDRMTEPLYRPFRRILPDFGGLDFSPMVVLLIILIIKNYLLPGAFASLAPT
jgi:YggT family protein